MFPSIFSSPVKEKPTQNTAVGGTASHVRHFATRMSLALGFAAASNIAISGPSAPSTPTEGLELTMSLDLSTRTPINNQSTLPPQAPPAPEKKITPIEPLSAPSKLRFARAEEGESVEFFMFKNFWIKEGHHLLVAKETGKRVLNPRKDLIAGNTYVLARDEKEAETLSNIFRKKASKQIKNIEEEREVQIETSVSIPSEEALKMDNSITRPRVSSSAKWQWGVVSGEEFVEEARNFLGMKYRLWGDGDGEIDCSGLIDQTARKKRVIDYRMPRLVSGYFKNIAQRMGEKKPQNAKIGDTIYTPPKEGQKYWHVMLISGLFKDGKFTAIHASSWKKKVVEGLVTYHPGMIIGTPPWVAGWESEYASTPKATTTKISVASYIPEKTGNQTLASDTVSDMEPTKTMLPATSANASQFRQEIWEKVSHIVSQDDIAVPEAKIESRLIHVSQDMTVSKPAVVSLVEREYKNEIIQKIQSDSTISETVRKSTIAILEKSMDLKALYENSLEHFRNIEKNGTWQEKQDIKQKNTIEKLQRAIDDLDNKLSIALNDPEFRVKIRA